MGCWASGSRTWVGLANIRSFQVRFTGQVWPDDVLTFTGRVEAVRHEPGEVVAELSVVLTRLTGDPAIKATATALVRQP